jgi:broad specificity phosphatase PhoE
MFCSPLERALRTSTPLARHLGLKVRVRADFCEIGGHYKGNGAQQTATPGRTRAELAAAFPTDHDMSEVNENGWWQSASGRFETAEELDARLNRVIEWLQERVWQHRILVKRAKAALKQLQSKGADTADPTASSNNSGEATSTTSQPPQGQPATSASPPRSAGNSPDYLVIVSHADFLNALLTRLFRVHEPPRYSFLHDNTAITHLELHFAAVKHWPKQLGNSAQREFGGTPAEAPAAAAPAAATDGTGFNLAMETEDGTDIVIDRSKDTNNANSTSKGSDMNAQLPAMSRVFKDDDGEEYRFMVRARRVNSAAVPHHLHSYFQGRAAH